MTPATWPRDNPRATRLLHIDPGRGALEDRTIGDLRSLLRGGDLLVVNDAATLPAALHGTTGNERSIEVRLYGQREDDAWRAVVFGAGDWRTPTERRPNPPLLRTGEEIRFDGLRARVVEVDASSPRLIWLIFDQRGTDLWGALYRSGHPVQYAYTERNLAIWNVQTPYAARPWAAEAPSAGFAMTWDLLLSLRSLGIGLARVTHAAGLSSTGDEVLDARLPLAERFEVMQKAVDSIDAARSHGGRIIAVGTSTTRALEAAAARGDGRLVACAGATDLILGPGTRRHVVDGILTGVHDAGTSHFSLLESFASRSLLDRAHALAESRGYLGHEFGDSMLILADRDRMRMDLEQEEVRAGSEQR